MISRWPNATPFSSLSHGWHGFLISPACAAVCVRFRGTAAPPAICPDWLPECVCASPARPEQSQCYNELMKEPVSGFGAILSLLLALLLSGCASVWSGNSPTLKDTDDDMSSSMAGFRIAVSAGSATVGEREKVNAAYTKYKAAFDEALHDAQNNENAPTPKDVKTLANEVVRVLSSTPY